jgi:hypothetical protein
MSILNYRMTNMHDPVGYNSEFEKRHERDALGDLKHGLDLIFELRDKLDKLHPIATEILIRLISN